MKHLLGILVISFLLLTNSCKRIGGYKYTDGFLPETPVNLSDFNTEYDDYNSTAPSLGRLIPFCFSSNRNTYANNFDVIYKPMEVRFDKDTGVLTVLNQYGAWGEFAGNLDIINQAIARMKTDANEFGPNLIVDNDVERMKFTFLYSTDITGNAQIHFVSNRSDINFSQPQEVSFLNSVYDDIFVKQTGGKRRF